MYTLGLSVTDVAGRTHIRLSASARPEPDSIARPDMEAWFTIIDTVGITAPVFSSPRQHAVDVLGWAYDLIRSEMAPDHVHSTGCPCSLEAVHGRMEPGAWTAPARHTHADADADGAAAEHHAAAAAADGAQA